MKKTKINNLINFYQKRGVFFIVLLEIIVFSMLNEYFVYVSNILNVGRQVWFIGIAAVGTSFLMIAGGIDISNGSMLAFSGVFSTMLIVNNHVPIFLAVLLTLALGFLLGGISGAAYTKFHVSPLIATLAMQTILKGIAFLLTDAEPIYGLPDSFKYLGQGYLFEVIPVPFLIMLIVFLIGYWVLNYTYMGRYIYAVGGNAEATRLSGIHVNRVNTLVFCVSGLSAAFAGILMAARLGSGQPSVGVDFPMDVITAIVLGGVSVNGGSGKLTGVFFGVFIMGILSNGMIMVGLNDYWQWLVKGLVLLFAVAASNVEMRQGK